MSENSVIRGLGRRVGRRRNAAVGAAVATGVLLAVSPMAHALDSAGHQPAAVSVKPAKPASADFVARKLTPAVRARVDRAIQQVMAQAKVPGVVASVSIPGKGTYERAFGVADTKTRAPMTTNVNMRVGSITKTFTATAVLQLADQKKLKLDDPISKYVPGVPQGDRITLRHLLEMRSGLASYMEDNDWAIASLTDPYRQWKPEEFLRYAFKYPVSSAPGTKYHYSNTNTVLLGMVVEKVSGQSLGRYMQQHIMQPAHLKHTFYPKGAEFPAPHAEGYTDQRDTVEDSADWNPHSIGGPAGAVISDLTDLQHWAQVLAKGSLLKHSTQQERTKFLPTDIEGTGYGLGMFNSHGWIGHNGSLPGYQTVMVYLPGAKATLVIHSNTDIRYQGASPSTMFAKAITQIVTPKNVYDLKPVQPATATAPAGH
ncbi:serine hydrolase [Streptomyces sp. NPDC002265]|uniref:serine hydrolase n=1 Tax=Streptomyces sp. NPDC002265 TaxID=3154415 RepID=UPI0033226C90